MSGLNIQNSRINQKYSTISGSTPSIAPSTDHTDGTWNENDIYIGELYINVQDDAMFFRSLNGIIPITSGTTTIDTTAFLNLTGGTLTGTLYAPTISATTISASTIYSPSFNGTFVGDGSGLTGITSTSVFSGGTVSGATIFTSDVDLCNANVTINEINNCGGHIDIYSDINVVGAVSATTFEGDGSLITNLPYVSGLTLDQVLTLGDTSASNDIQLTNGNITLTNGTYFGDGSGLTGIPPSPIPTLDEVLVSGDTSTNGNIYLTNGDIVLGNGIYYGDGSGLTNLIATTDIFVTGGTYSSGTAIFTNNSGGTFNVTGFSTGGSGDFLPLSGGTVSGGTQFTAGLTANTISATTYQNLPINTDVFVTGGTYNNGTGIATFTNNTGSTFNVTGFTTGFTETQNLTNVLALGNTTGANNIVVEDGQKIESVSGNTSIEFVSDTELNIVSTGDVYISGGTSVEIEYYGSPNITSYLLLNNTETTLHMDDNGVDISNLTLTPTSFTINVIDSGTTQYEHTIVPTGSTITSTDLITSGYTSVYQDSLSIQRKIDDVPNQLLNIDNLTPSSHNRHIHYYATGGTETNFFQTISDFDLHVTETGVGTESRLQLDTTTLSIDVNDSSNTNHTGRLSDSTDSTITDLGIGNYTSVFQDTININNTLSGYNHTNEIVSVSSGSTREINDLVSGSTITITQNINQNFVDNINFTLDRRNTTGINGVEIISQLEEMSTGYYSLIRQYKDEIDTYVTDTTHRLTNIKKNDNYYTKVQSLIDVQYSNLNQAKSGFTFDVIDSGFSNLTTNLSNSTDRGIQSLSTTEYSNFNQSNDAFVTNVYSGTDFSQIYSVFNQIDHQVVDTSFTNYTETTSSHIDSQITDLTLTASTQAYQDTTAIYAYVTDPLYTYASNITSSLSNTTISGVTSGDYSTVDTSDSNVTSSVTSITTDRDMSFDITGIAINTNVNETSTGFYSSTQQRNHHIESYVQDADFLLSETKNAYQYFTKVDNQTLDVNTTFTQVEDSILTTATDNGYGYISSKEIKPQQHQTQFSRQGNIFTIEDKRAGWMQTADDTAALMIYCDVDPAVIVSGSSIVQIKAHVRGISSDKTTGYAAEITSWVRLVQSGGTPITQIGVVDYTIKSEFTTASSSFVISGPNMYIDVTGEIGITIDWTCNVEILYDKNTF